MRILCHLLLGAGLSLFLVTPAFAGTQEGEDWRFELPAGYAKQFDSCESGGGWGQPRIAGPASFMGVEGTPEIKMFVRAGGGEAQSAFLVIAADLKEEMDGVTEKGLMEMRRGAETKGAEVVTVEKTFVHGGQEAARMHAKASAPDGTEVHTHALVVPRGDRMFMLMFITADPTAVGEFDAAIASVRLTSSGPGIWLLAVGALGLIGLFFLIMKLRSPRMQPVQIGQIRVDDAETWIQQGSHVHGAPHASGAGPAAPRTPPAIPQIPGLQSTLPPSGRWGQ